MAIYASKGAALKIDISGTMTAIPQILSITKSGELGETFEAKTLDGNVHPAMPNSGYVSCPTITAEIFFDADDTTQQAVLTHMRAPAAKNYNITRTDTTPSVETWSITGVGFDENLTAGDGAKGTITLQTSGNPS